LQIRGRRHAASVKGATVEPLVFDGNDMRNPDFNTAQRLYELLDTLVAMRLDFGNAPNQAQEGEAFGPEKMAGARQMLDAAIASTKLIIGKLDRQDDADHRANDRPAASP
jgi:hypothetical protein